MIKCIKNKDYEYFLTLNKMYKSLGNIRSSFNTDKLVLISVIDDSGLTHWVPENYFITISEERDITLTKLGI